VGRPVILSNNHVLVGLDDHACVHDFYFPYIGLDNLTSARNLNHKVGVWVDNQFSWLDDGSWQIDIDFEEDALVSNIVAKNEALAITLSFSDFVDTHYPVFARIIDVRNDAQDAREVRLFMHQAFQISRAGRSDTAMYVPGGNYLLDYKGWASLLIYAQTESGQAFDQFAVGNCGIEGKEGTFRDAEDGELGGGLVEHGGVDSVIRLKLNLEANSSDKVYYWVVASDSQFDAEAIHASLKKGGLQPRLDATRQNFSQWLAIALPQFAGLSPQYQKAAKKSLLVVKSHIDKHGGIIASCDSSIYNYGRDYYSYVWPRDGAYAMLPLIELGYQVEPKKFFEFCADVIHPNGYMMHKYQPDRAVGSTWHPQLHKNHPELPIQEDETAIVLYALGRYLDKFKDLEFMRINYDHLIKPAADFMSKFMDEQTGLPHASYDLWEERFACHSYTAAATIAGLRAAVMIAKCLNKTDYEPWEATAAKIEENFQLLYNQDGKYLRKSLLLDEAGSINYDETLDASSFYGLFLFTPHLSEYMDSTLHAVEERLLAQSPSGGSPRYEHDNYFLTKPGYTGNPWILTTLWLAQYYIKSNRKDEAIALIDWALAKTTSSGMLAEQVDPETSEPVGVLPLVWSHSTLAETLLLLAESS